jgi:uncharacterized protein YjbJ (UPF0337 family)
MQVGIKTNLTRNHIPGCAFLLHRPGAQIGAGLVEITPIPLEHRDRRSFQIVRTRKDIPMGSTLDKVKGVANEVGGKTQKAVGKAIDNKEMQVKGSVQEAKGEAQQAVGKAKDTVKKAVDRL